jgi:hypothetical protein
MTTLTTEALADVVLSGKRHREIIDRAALIISWLEHPMTDEDRGAAIYHAQQIKQIAEEASKA